MSEEPVSKYGLAGKKIVIGGVELQIDEEFIIATILAVVAALNTIHVGIDEHISVIGQKIYDEITEAN